MSVPTQFNRRNAWAYRSNCVDAAGQLILVFIADQFHHVGFHLSRKEVEDRLKSLRKHTKESYTKDFSPKRNSQKDQSILKIPLKGPSN
eukprot:2066792-Amphidinium_carterae.1